jgi:phage shock protein PspC (stress-responsive transcriptional regulator)
MDTTNSGTTGPSAGASDEAAPSDVRLYRAADGRMLGGVAAGLANHFGIDTTIVRLGFVVLGLCGGLAVPFYVAGWLLIPEEGSESTIADELLGYAHLQ